MGNTLSILLADMATAFGDRGPRGQVRTNRRHIKCYETANPCGLWHFSLCAYRL